MTLVMKNEENNVVNLDDFVLQKEEAKFPLQPIIRFLVREVNKQKLSYCQLKYIFQTVRAKCQIDVGNKAKRLIELPSEEELAAFFNAIKNPIHRLIFDSLLGTGLRVSELCSLEVKRLDLKSNQFFIHEGKGKKDRIAIVGNKLKEKLELYLQGKQNRYLFESARHTRFTTRRIEQLCMKYKRLSGIDKKLTPHSFRHIWNTKLATQGLDKEKRALLAGHENDKTQDLYTHMGLGGFKSEVIKLLDN